MTNLKNSSSERLIREEQALRKARRNFTTYKHVMWHRYQHPRHLGALDEALMLCTRHAETGGQEGVGFLLVEMPPRHGKTTTISRLYPTWHIGNHPDHRVILASYGAALAHKNSRYARNTLLMPRYQAVFPGVALAADSKAVDAWDVVGHEGGLDAIGVGGGVTGKGGNIIIVDDPVKSREEAESDVYRNKVWDWFTDDLYTRREPGAALVVVMTRWHMDDLVGRILREQSDKWTRLRMPALAEHDDPLGRREGEALWPERFSVRALQDIRDVQHDYAFSALYQQNPVPAEGGLFKRRSFHLIDPPDPNDMVQVVRFWDLAMSSKTSADYTVGAKMASLTNGRIAILDVQRQRIEWDEVTPFIADVALGDGPGVQIGLEEAGYMTRAGQMLAADHRLSEFGIWGYPKDKDKLTNALPFASRVGQDMVDMVRAWWNDDFLDELCSFPLGAYDDQVDAAAGAYHMLGTLAGIGTMNYATQQRIGESAY